MKPEVTRHFMYYGLIVGLVFCLNFFLSTRTGALALSLSWMITLAIPVIVTRMAIHCRERVLDGVISYGTALIYGIQLFFYASLLSGAFRYVYCQWLAPDFLPNQVNSALLLVEQMGLTGLIESNGMTMNQYAEALRSMFTPVNMSLMALVINCLAGLLVSLVTAAIVKRDKNSVQHNN
ncbi:MAG: DUF4199 domain-containing protein [Prevotellaceae bacterium]|jgi:hypothetical protein|nr:DUF4199 domain-containing protein [Prevotellaceae bacterium]